MTDSHSPHLPLDLPLRVTLREVRPSDVAVLYEFECDPAWGAMALVRPRTREAFEAIWTKIFADRASSTAVGAAEGIVQRAILANGELCGVIGTRLVEGQCSVGYGLGRPHWGKGIMSRALGLVLAEVSRRPIHATAAATNAASIRVLTRHGFVITGRRAGPETERYVACEEVCLVLEG